MLGTHTPAGAPVRRGSTPKMSHALLFPHDRIAREPLEPWARRLLDTLEKGRKAIRDTRRLAGEVGFIGNNAGLIAASRGDINAAWRLTERQIWWHGRQARRSGDAAVAAYGVQPWVNLGRLEAVTGQWREALARFAGFATYPLPSGLEMGCVRLNGTAWAALAMSHEQVRDFFAAVYVSDSLKALLLNRRFDLIQPFTRRFDAIGSLQWICEESCVVAECFTGDPSDAAARASAATRQARGWNRAVLRLRAAEAYACAGDLGRSAEILVQLATVVRQVSPEQKANPRMLPMITRLAAACDEAGLTGEAHAVARNALEGARAARDEPIQIESLRILAATAPPEGRAEWEDALAELEETTEYARYRRGGPPPPNPVIEGLYEQLNEVFSN